MPLHDSDHDSDHDRDLDNEHTGRYRRPPSWRHRHALGLLTSAMIAMLALVLTAQVAC